MDIKEDKKHKHEALISGLSDVRRELHQSEAKIVVSKNEVGKQFSDTLVALKAAKVETLKNLTRNFDKMIKYASKQKTKTAKDMEKEIFNIDSILTAFDSLNDEVTEDSSISYEDIIVKLRAVEIGGDLVKEYLSKERIYQYLEHHGNRITSQDQLCGSLSINKVRIVMREDIPQEGFEVQAQDGTEQVGTLKKPRTKRRRSTKRSKASPFTYKGKKIEIFLCSKYITITS